MSNVTEKWRERLKKRKRAEARFHYFSLTAVIMAGLFLCFFFYDIISKGYSAFVQTQIQVNVTYNQDSVELPFLAVAEEYEVLVSRGFIRMIPRQVEQNPQLMGTREDQWVLASSDVDQYYKGKANRLSESEKGVVDELAKEGRVRAVFNRWLFINGDSQLPEQAGLRAAMIGSIYVMLITILFSVPIGVLTSIYLEEFAPGNFLTRTIEVNINNLAAIPSILFGVLGLAIFINFFGVPRSSVLAGGLTLGLMMLPIVIISTRAALRAVPDTIRQAALSVGASRWQAVRHHVLPHSMTGILTGTIIGVAQSIGETAPLLVVGMMAFIQSPPSGVMDAATVLPAQVFRWFGESQRGFEERQAAGIMVLLAVLMLLNATAIWLRHKQEKRW